MRARLMLACLFVTAFPMGACANTYLGAAVVDEIDGVGSTAATLSWETDQVHPWEIMGGVLRARHDRRLRTPRVLFASVSKRFTYRGWFVQSGIAATSSNTEALSGHWQFMTGIGYRYQRFTVSLRHMSNANTTGRNRGENVLLFQYGF